MKIKVILADEDKEYIKHFTRTIQIYYNDAIDLVAFSNEDSLKAYIKENKSYDLVLMTQDFMYITFKPNSTVLLTETNGIKEENGVRAIGKYQRINKIYDEIVDIFSEIRATMKMNAENSADTHFIGFTSTAGGTGKTTISIAYSRKLVEKGYQVLYLSLDCFSTINNMFNGKGEYSFSNVIFVLKSKKGNIQIKLESALRQVYGAIHYLTVPESPYEIPGVKKDEWQEFFEAVKNMKKYHYVVIDMPDIMNGLSKDILDMLDKVVIVSDSTDVVAQKNQALYDYHKKSNSRGLTDYVMVQNKSSGGKRDIGIPVVAELPFISGCKGMGVVDAILADNRSEALINIHNPGGDR